MNNRRRQKIRALNMMIRSKSNSKIGYDQLVKFAQWLMEGITEAMHQASAFLVSLGESIQPFIRAYELVEQFKADISAEDEINSEDASCDSCYHYLGGGCCRINLESECREGGGYEAWVPRIAPLPALEASLESKEAPESEEEPEADNKPNLPKPS